MPLWDRDCARGPGLLRAALTVSSYPPQVTWTIFLAAFVEPGVRIIFSSIPKSDIDPSNFDFVFWLPYLAIFYCLAVLMRSFGGIKELGEALKAIEPGANEALRASGLRQYKIVTGYKCKHKHTPPPLEGTACQMHPLWLWIDVVKADVEAGVVGWGAESPIKPPEAPQSAQSDDKPPAAKSSWAESLSGPVGGASGSAFANSDNTFASSDNTFDAPAATFAPTKFG